MRKHFLLLFLLTLLPLAGWATDYSVYVNAKAISITYGTANPAADAVDVNMFTANLVGTGAGVDNAVKAAIAEKLTFATERVATSPVSGSYTFTLALADVTDNTVTDGLDNYTILLQEATNDLVVTKAAGAVVQVTPVLVTDALSFTTAEQDLLSVAGSGSITGTEITGLPLEYSYDNGAHWRDNTKFTDAGTYTITYRVKETENYAASATATLDAKVVDKATPVVAVPVLVSSLTYTGVGQEVISTPGEANFGATVTYNLQKYNNTTTNWDDVSYNTDKALVKATDAGKYRLTFDMRNWTMSTEYLGEKEKPAVEPISLEHLYIIGSATPGGWDWGQATELTKSSDYIFVYEGELKTGELKFSGEKDWDASFIHCPSDGVKINKDGVEDEKFEYYAGGNDNKWKVEVLGKYRLTLDLEHWTIRSEFLGELQKETHIYMIGDATAGGWAWDKAQEFTQDASNKDVFTWEGQLTEGTFKMSEEKDFNAPFYRPSSANVTVDASGVSASDMVFTASPDDQWKVTEAGTYQITIDINNKTIKVVKK